MLQIDELVAESLCLGIIHQAIPPIEKYYQEGWNDHRDGKKFHEHRYDHWSPEALSWRIGWNDRALQEQD